MLFGTSRVLERESRLSPWFLQSLTHRTHVQPWPILQGPEGQR
jgi:hypothetical protein